MKDRTRFYTIAFWTSLGIIFIWLILKSLGYINTPLIIELLPLFSAAFGAGIFFEMMRELRRDIKIIKMNLRDMNKRVYKLEIQNNKEGI